VDRFEKLSVCQKGTIFKIEAKEDILFEEISIIKKN
jgi:hypothetical protein